MRKEEQNVRYRFCGHGTAESGEPAGPNSTPRCIDLGSFPIWGYRPGSVDPGCRAIAARRADRARPDSAEKVNDCHEHLVRPGCFGNMTPAGRVNASSKVARKTIRMIWMLRRESRPSAARPSSHRAMLSLSRWSAGMPPRPALMWPAAHRYCPRVLFDTSILPATQRSTS